MTETTTNWSTYKVFSFFTSGQGFASCVHLKVAREGSETVPVLTL